MRSMGMRSYVAAMALAALVCAGRSDGAISPKYADFVRGPAQWLMTPAEARAIRSASTDAEAQKAIDLFWVRRDPTPGTPGNEFRDELEARVVYADRELGFRGKRGSMTDLGKVFILLGPPLNFQKYSGLSTLEAATANTVISHGMGGKFEWEYPPGGSLGLTGPVVFIENLSNHEFNYDLQHSNIAGALSMARQRAIVNAGLMEVPSWAVPKATEIAVPDVTPAAPVTPVAASAVRVARPSAASAPAASPVLPASVGLLLLTKDVMTINPRAAGDPLAQAAATRSFTAQDDLGYAFQYCGGSSTLAAPPALGLTMTISGESDGKKVHFSAADDELAPDGIPALAGCYLLRGSLPLGDVGKGTYELAISLTDKASHQTYALKHDFQVE